MPPSRYLRFPFPLQLGTDICAVPRIYSLLYDKGPENGPRFVQRILTQRELSACCRRQPTIYKAIFGEGLDEENGENSEEDTFQLPGLDAANPDYGTILGNIKLPRKKAATFIAGR